MKYSAKKDYQSQESAETYESRPMYRGLLGARRQKIEKTVIQSAVDQLPDNIVILDCPCGNGRWFSTLAQKAHTIIGMDVSTGMTNYARARTVDSKLEVMLGDAENIGLPDNSVDYVFSYALLKHIPYPVQHTILKEFSRVSRQGIICSFPIFNHISYAFWKYKHPEESYPIFREGLDTMASFIGMDIKQISRISQPLLGLEHLVWFHHRDV